jgi:hypothetical protein
MNDVAVGFGPDLAESPPRTCSRAVAQDNRSPPGDGQDASFDLKSDVAGLILNRVAATGDEEVVSELINAGAPVGIVDLAEVTALANAAGSGKQLAVNLLIQSGADAKNPRVLMEAARSGSPAVVSRILQAGADAKANIPGIRFLLFSAVSSRGRSAEGVDRGSVVRLLGVGGRGSERSGREWKHPFARRPRWSRGARPDRPRSQCECPEQKR